MQKMYLLMAFIFVSGIMYGQDKESLNSSKSVIEEFRVKREEIFEFVQKPQITKEGNNYTISFESKSFCDVTIAIENSEGKIVRHLVSGVLGAKAPAPLQINSKIQKIVWDGKNDQEVYVKDEERIGCTIRVSLGLKPQLERTMFWSPKKRIGFNNPVMCAAPEGIYIAETSGVEQVRLFDHQGNYVRTIYPFPSGKIDKVVSLKMHNFIQDGKSKPIKRGYLQGTLLTTFGDGMLSPGTELPGIVAITATKGQVAISGLHLNRLGADGSSAGLPIYGPQLAIPIVIDGIYSRKVNEVVSPRSMAFSPDGKWLYLASYSGIFGNGSGGLGGSVVWRDAGWINAVTRMPYDSSQPPTLFVGDLASGKSGKEDNQLRMPTSVACDLQGRVYVSDHMNDRIQIFNPEGKLLKSIPTPNPTYVSVHQKTGDIYAFSYWLPEFGRGRDKHIVPEPIMSHFGPFDNPVLKNKCPLPINNNDIGDGFQHIVEFDSWADKPTIWIMNGSGGTIIRGDGGDVREIRVNKDGGVAQLFEETENKLVHKQSFIDDVKKDVIRLVPPILWRQRLVVNPATGKVYVLEGDSGCMKSVNELVELSPDTGGIKLVNLPLGAEDLCFDINGLVYIRTDIMVARYDPKTWLEIPFDYGVEMEKHGFGMGARTANIVSGLLTPGHRSFNFWHLGGIDISIKGHIAVTTCNGFEMEALPKGQPGEVHAKPEGKLNYTPISYKGRMRWGEIHIWDKHGKLIKEDAVPGMGHLNGIGIDQEDNIYMLTVAKRIIDGKQTDPAMGYDSSGTVLKVLANKNKVYSSSNGIPVPLPLAEQPKRSIDISGYTTGWVEGADWLYGGVGYCINGGCICWNSRFSKDYYNRSFAPEARNCSVAVIDTNGNLILRVGKYGNVDDGKPLISEGGPKETNSIGGDEVGLFYANYVASHTDKRLFIADAGNTRVLSVKLGYHTEEKIPINSIQDKK